MRAQENTGILIVDTDLVVSSWDAWMAHATGISTEQACGQPLTALIPDLEARGLLPRIQRVMQEGVVEVLAPALHGYLIPCPLQTPSEHFTHMQQRVVIVPLHADERVVGALITVQDVTARLDQERTLTTLLSSPDEAVRLRATERLAALKATEAQQVLLGVLDDESWHVRRAAVDGLTRQGSALDVTALLRTLRYEHHSLSVLNSVLQVLAASDVDVLAPLCEFLTADDADLRTYAALALGERGDPRAAPALLSALDDPDSNVRYHAIEALGKLRAQEAVEPLVHIAETRDFFLAFPALDALTSIGDPAVAPRIVPLLDDELLRQAAADALGALGDETAVAPLVARLNAPDAPAAVIARSLVTLFDRYEHLFGEGRFIADLFVAAVDETGQQNLLAALPDAHGDELRALVLVLGWLDSPDVIQALAQLLGQADVRKEVVAALVRYGARVTDVLIAQLSADDPDVRRTAVVALGRIGDQEAVPALLPLLKADADMIILAAGALARLGDHRAFEPLLALLGHPLAAVRQAVIAALNSIGYPDMPACIAELMESPDSRTRESAVRIAGYFGFAETESLLFARCDDEDPQVQSAALEGVANLVHPQVLPTLVGALESPHTKVRAAAVRALGHVEDHRSVFEPLLGALADEDMWVRYYAARALGQHGFPEAVGALAQRVREDVVPMVRAAALEALGRIGGARAVAVVAPFAEDADDDLARTALAALGRISHPDALPPLLAALRAPEASRRVWALKALGRRGGRGAVGALQWVAATDSEPQVSETAIEMLAQLGTPEAIAALLALAVDASYRDACVSALAGLGVEKIEDVARGLAHVHPRVRQATVLALARMKYPAATAQIRAAAAQDTDESVRATAMRVLRQMQPGAPLPGEQRF